MFTFQQRKVLSDKMAYNYPENYFKTQGKIALNLAKKWLIITHIPEDKSVVRQNALKSS